MLEILCVNELLNFGLYWCMSLIFISDTCAFVLVVHHLQSGQRVQPERHLYCLYGGCFEEYV